MSSFVQPVNYGTRDSVPVAAARQKSSRWGFAEWFIISQTLIPAFLFLPGTQALRLPLRIAPFAVSLAALVWRLDKRIKGDDQHPALFWLTLALGYVALMIFHPNTNAYLAGLAQLLLYISVLAPVIWVPCLMRGPQHLGRLLVLILICSGANAFVGVMQVRDPANWMPAQISRAMEQNKYGVDYYTYEGPDGRRIIRPPGLFDTPGAVSAPGAVAGFLGLVFFLNSASLLRKASFLLLSVAGAVAIYLSQVRTSILILGGMIFVYILILLMQRQRAKAVAFGGLAVAVIVVCLSYAVVMGGENVSKRFSTLVERDPSTVYQANRGGQLEHGFRVLLYDYPLGAGLGRWGMMRVYFGEESNLNSPSIWAELQFPAWILDGGLFLMFFYCAALIGTAIHEFKILKTATDPEFRKVAAVVFAINAGTLALVFGFTPFTTQLGTQYWFLAGALHGVALRYRDSRSGLLPSGKW